MKKVAAALAVVLGSSVLAGVLHTKFLFGKRTVDSIVVNGKLLAEVGELAYAFGYMYTVSGTTVTAYIGTKASTTIQASRGGQLDWLYIDPLLLAKNLGYTAKLGKTTDPKTKLEQEVLTIEYKQKITCNDFKFWEDAQRFYKASSSTSVIGGSPDFQDQDPYNLDRSKDGAACESLPRYR
jgi:hypothetical protein